MTCNLKNIPILKALLALKTRGKSEKSRSVAGRMVTQYIRVVCPRRKENVLNLLLATVLACMLCFFYVRIYSQWQDRLPPEEGRTWPMESTAVHKPPDPNEKRSGSYNTSKSRHEVT